MIPKKIRRTIKVNNEEWEYCIGGRHCAKIFLHNLKTNQKLSWYMEDCDYIPITPKDIRTIIEKKELAGIKAK